MTSTPPIVGLLNVYETKHAEHFLYQLLAQRTPVESISHTAMPSVEHHNQFVASRPYRMWSIIRVVNDTRPWDWVGSVLLTRNNEIGISIAAEHRRKGYASAALKQVLANYSPLPADASKRPGRFVANINPKNHASIALFTGLGAVHIQNSYAFEERP